MAVTYNKVWDDIYDQLCNKLERKKDGRLRFAARGTVPQVLHDGNLQLFFRALVPASWAEEEDELMVRITMQSFIDRIKERRLHEFLATLIFASCSLAAARAFVLKLLVPNDWPIRDRKGRDMGVLPVDITQLFEIFESNVDADKFYSKQACFCPVVLRKRQEVKVKSLTSQRLPYLEEMAIGEGSFGKIFRVKVAAGHFEDPNTEFSYNTEPILMARKDYTLTDNGDVREEHEIMKKILGYASRGCENIVESFGGISIGNNFSLFMPLAVCDLRSYMMDYHPTRPNTKEAKAEIILCAQGLASGLNFLHHEMTTPDLEDMVCYHMDLTPNNILVFIERRDGHVRPIWKLSDFGMSRVKIRHRGQGVERERDFNSLFVRRQIKGPSLSGTLNRRGEGTYLAPESIDSNPRMRTGSDVWSLGCVLSVVFAYLQGGSLGVTAYQDARLKYRDADGYDRFFLRGYKFSRTRTHPVVREWHKKLVHKAEERDHREGKAFRYMLRHLEESVLLIKQAERSDARRVRDMLATTYRIYMSPEDAENERFIQLTVPKDPIWNKLFQQKRKTCQSNADEWPLTSEESFKGCVISPDATLVAYWTDIKISLYTSQSLMPRDGQREGHELMPAAEYPLKETDCFWKSVTLTNEYLIASTTGRSYCYIFDLEAGTAVDATLDHLYRIALPFPEIYRLAISPDSETLACVLRHEDGDRHPGTLLYASVPDLVALATPRPSIVSEIIPIGTNMRPGTPSTPWKTVDIGWPAADVVQLTISDDKDVHLVIRPELTAKSREHKIPIMHVSLRQATVDTLFIESRGFDSSGTAGFFTTFCPFIDVTTCAVVTREKRIHFQTFNGDDPILNQQKDILNCRILKLINGQHDERLFALGTTSANHRIKLLEIGIPQPGVELSIQELAQFPGLSYGDDFTGVVSDDNGKTFVLVATLAGANGRKLYKVDISNVPPTV
ncbi:hypothetical protein PT974_07203 [Cladobotryum mycophilum]|uniref:EKC/KEOPS complex subunit BUD32 n=1 Tax=Cladobotryum mycophilum TaxID=491253 RepID=A0ABR0SPR3_9HYPO